MDNLTNLVEVPSCEEKRRGPIEWVRVMLILFLNSLPPKIAQFIFCLWGEDPRKVFATAATWQALEVMYTYPQRRNKGKVDLGSIFWENFLDNARAVRNRMSVVKAELIKIILLQRGEEVRILSVGSGSARPLLEAVKEVKLLNAKAITVLLFDRDREAINFSSKLAEELKVDHRAVIGNFFRIETEEICVQFKPVIIELVGILDYLSDRQAVFLLRKLYNILQEEGFLVTGNISLNPEAPFVTRGINWPMIYRTPEDLRRLLTQAGFKVRSIKEESLGIHLVAVAQKSI